jgi:uncharacterized lipoprotein YmbA
MRPLFCFALLWFLTACSSAPTQTQRYTFAVSTAPVSDAPFGLPGGLGIGPVELPEFWRQREVVLVEKNKIISDDRHLWAGDPKLAISRVIATMGRSRKAATTNFVGYRIVWWCARSAC